jgi:hypothetical protein
VVISDGGGRALSQVLSIFGRFANIGPNQDSQTHLFILDQYSRFPIRGQSNNYGDQVSRTDQLPRHDIDHRS